MTHREIADTVDLFAGAASRAKEAGFDGVEIHGAHVYLIASFLSTATNFRRDEYGGDIKNRARFLLRVLRRVRDTVRKDFPVWVRINGKEWMENGLSNEDAAVIASLAEQEGSDAVHVSAWGVRNQNQTASLPTVPGGLIPLAGEIKKAVRIPIIAVGMISSELGEKALIEEKTDFIAFGRALIADPELPLKVTRSRIGEICPCIACMYCRGRLMAAEDIGCQVNPAVGRERESEITPAKTHKKVLIIGGGPAGMEAACTAALRKHRVTLWEKESRLGGQLLQAIIPPHKERLAPLLSYYNSQLHTLKVPVELKRATDAEAIRAFKPDAVILATGSKPIVPSIMGIERPQVVHAGDILDGKAEAKQRVVIIGGEMVGCETAEFLAQKGKQVTVTRRGKKMAQKVTPSVRELLLLRLEELGVRLLPEVDYKEITDSGLVVKHEGQEELIEADTIVLAAGAVPIRELSHLEGVPVQMVGDCQKPRGIREAIAEGRTAALSLD